MTVQDFVQLIVTFVKEHEQWAIPIAFLVAFGESFCFLSILWPGTAILVGISGLLAASGVEISILLPCIIAAAAGGTLGYAISYWIGLYFKDSIPNIWPFRSQPELISKGEAFFEKWGAWSVFFGHFFGPVRAVIPVVAGMFQMRQFPFQIANVVSAIIWSAGVIAPSYFAVMFKEDILTFVRDHQLISLILMFAAAFVNSIPMLILAIPSLLLFVATGALFLYAGGDPVSAVLGGVLGALAGDMLAYMNGRRRQNDFHMIWPNSFSGEAARTIRDRQPDLGCALDDCAAVAVLHHQVLGLLSLHLEGFFSTASWA
jgi:membrane protein DedA with SNARE-associated domain